MFKNWLPQDLPKLDMYILPKSNSGLANLKDYHAYPKIYWELRAETIAQPQDLERDMIERDLYKLKQISALKLSAFRKGFSVKTECFRNWKSKAGCRLRSSTMGGRKQAKAKTTVTASSQGDNPETKLLPEVRVTPLPLAEIDHHADEKVRAGIQESTRNGRMADQVCQPNLGQVRSTVTICPAFAIVNHFSEGSTPTEAVKESSDTPREKVTRVLQKSTKLPTDRNPDEKGTCCQKVNRKILVKAALIMVNPQFANVASRQHRCTPGRQSSVAKDNFSQSNASAIVSHRGKYYSREPKTYRDVTETLKEGNNEFNPSNKSHPVNNNGRRRSPATAAAALPIGSIIFSPPLNCKVPRRNSKTPVSFCHDTNGISHYNNQQYVQQETIDTIASRYNHYGGKTMSSWNNHNRGETMGSRYNHNRGETMAIRYNHNIGETMENTNNHNRGETIVSQYNRNRGETMESRYNQNSGEILNSRKAVVTTCHLEVFSEKKALRAPIEGPTGQIPYHSNMSSYKYVS